MTTAVDAGSAGFSNFGVFRRHTIETAPVRVIAFVHVAAAGLVTTVVGELEDFRYARPRETAAIVRENRDVVAGVKVRLGTGACGDNVDAALDAALEAAELAATPLMAHIAEGADLRAVLPRLRPGDIVTHAFTASGPGILGDDGRVLPEAHDAAPAGRPLRRRPWLRQLLVGDRGPGPGRGPRPDSISTDLHRYSIERPVVDLPTTMSRYPRPRAVARRGRHRDDVGPGGDPGPAGARHAAPRQPGRCQRAPARRDAGRAPRFAGGPPDRAHQARAGHDDRGGVLHRAADVELRLRPYLDADREVDCSVPI